MVHSKIGLCFDLRPTNKQELFNLRHASARNVIERIFEVFKKRFEIMAHGCEYKIETQILLVTVMYFFHNFIQIKDPNGSSEDFPEFGEDFIPEPPTQEESGELEAYGSTAEGNNYAKILRDRIAEDMWRDYLEETERRKKVNRSRQRHGQPPMYPDL